MIVDVLFISKFPPKDHVLCNIPGIEENHGGSTVRGCHNQNVLGYEIEVCFCQDQNCNSAHGLSPSNGLLALLAVQTVVLMLNRFTSLVR